MRNDPRAGFAAALLFFILDQASKLGVTRGLGLTDLSDVVEITPFFNLRFVPNHGVSLGFLHASSDPARWALVALTAAIASGVAVWITREPRRVDQIALGAILGGAVGNIVDRVRLGYVIDFLDLHFGDWRPFLVFNVADAAITLGVLVLLVRALLMRDKAADSTENSHA